VHLFHVKEIPNPFTSDFKEHKHIYIHFIPSTRMSTGYYAVYPGHPSPYYCDPCRREFISAKSLQLHLTRSQRHMYCEWCESEVGEGLHHHNQQNHEQCPECGIWAANQDDICDHFQHDHADIYCSFCVQLFDYPNELNTHNQQCHEQCPECGIWAANQDEICDHFQHDHADIYCSFCVQLFDHPNELDMHNQQCHEQCPECGIWAAGQDDICDHFQNDHADIYCSPCVRLFGHPNELDMHLRSGIHQPASVFCPHEGCRKGFVSGSALVAPFEAGVCASGVTLERVDEMFAYSCDEAQLVVDRRLIFAQRRWRLPVRPDGGWYACPYCDNKLFAHPAQLVCHLQSPKHKNHGHRPYVCPDRACNHASFYSLSSLLLHRETTGCGLGHSFDLLKLVHRLYDCIARL